MLDDGTYVLLKRLFEAYHQKTVEVVYDIDDVLWSCIGAAAQRCKIPLKKSTATYSIMDNPELSPAEREALVEAFHDVQTFQNIKFYRGVTDILRPREFGASVRLRSNSFNEEIAFAKERQLLDVVPGLCSEDFDHHIVSWDNRHKKPLPETTTILVDDSPYNVQQSPALANFMPLGLAWSNDACAMRLTRSRFVVRKQNLITINQEVYKLTGVLLGLQYPYSQSPR